MASYQMQLITTHIDEEEYMNMVKSLNSESFDDEEWVDLYSYASDYYQVSSLGRFKAKQDIIYSSESRRIPRPVWRAGEIVKQNFNFEYTHVNLYIPEILSKLNQFSFAYSHIVIFKSFNNCDTTGMYVDHINGNKHDNRICNLQLLTPSENNKKAYLNDESDRWTCRKSAVVCVELDKKYDHLKYAVDDTGVSDAAILSAIKVGRTAGGYHWKYADEDKQAEIERSRPEKRVGITVQSTWIHCIETDDMMICTDMARKFNCGSEVIYNAIDFNGGYSKYLDKNFEVLDYDKIDFTSEKLQNYIQNTYYKKYNVVYNHETGLYFMSMKQAADWFGINKDLVKDSISMNKKVCKKYTFSKLI